ncbi:MAG: tRNA 2-selenouridine(34) synthase MnmH [Desulfuromonas sp.]|nr:MAG: tRNA 2-selenouridine(34) synthase MnmH [Desulfuromonas sp.]
MVETAAPEPKGCHLLSQPLLHPTIDLQQALEQRRRGALLVDVRSPSEFAETTIPDALNAPIFDDDERAQVGTLYKQLDKKTARRRGIELVSPKIPQLLQRIDEARNPDAPPVIVFCWRGGLRSLAVTTFLNLAGIPARQLVGGHKAFRRMVAAYFETENWSRVLVLRGMTGVGKTQLLQQLATENYPVVDLEGLANHRGSAFGALGLEPQPGQKYFEALLWDRLDQLRNSPYLLTEGESLHIGRLVVPKRFHHAMQTETSLWLEAPLDYRVDVILNDYPALNDLRDAFESPILALKERLGKVVVNELLALLHRGEWRQLVRELMVRYYDPLYSHTLPARRSELKFDSFDEGIDQIREEISTQIGTPQPGADTTD